VAWDAQRRVGVFWGFIFHPLARHEAQTEGAVGVAGEVRDRDRGVGMESFGLQQRRWSCRALEDIIGSIM